MSETSIYIKRFVRQSVCHSVTFCLSPGTNNLFVPRGTNISYTQKRGGQTFLTHRREGGQTFFVEGGGDHDYVDEEMDVS